jgi:pyruvate,orthophosphate dikinase
LDPRTRDKTIVGGKGANLAEMGAIGLPVPPGFTITTEVCVAYLAKGAAFSESLRGDVAEALPHLLCEVFGPSTSRSFRAQAPHAREARPAKRRFTS